ncbi:MAG: hypothetical protein A3J55_03425 [Candidatus Ryanbacteria bacterium RIFCSPHIGHO2_02_FULL_45_17b]|uniref:WD40 repeat domain-containing protein n=1 Tax=Candidatus Ryanbacteria bacterium RIFCSPHIGHO2_01_FULL_45_22 TaxID=1802114 RepID=A0A1G2G2W2_9BACT|nr:MAG: hypothetical protein A2719_04630 [Candidatus Ryanbacteria bacterium RIFCSPHIGHO2_01_FULL_45_22]OGZ47512.1 MAG: hypothetical protein A3J55_03425 [Candidatus Ryanbacteria bacterium RIFCSPHIGHO2_02_FULL_45_17b]
MNTDQTNTSRRRIITLTLLALGVILLIILLFIFWGDADGDGNTTDSFFGALFNKEEFSSTEDPLRGGVIIGEDGVKNEDEQTLYLISQDPVVGASLSSNGTRVRYFKQAGGNLYETEFMGTNETRISNVTIPGILDVSWTPSKTYAVISFYADGELRRLYAHYTGTSTVSSGFLPSDIQTIAASLTNDTIAYTTTTGGETILFTAQPDNTAIRKIFTLPAPDFEVLWPSANSIVLKQKSSSYASSILFTLNPSSKLLTRVLSEKIGLAVLWRPGDTDFLYMDTEREGTRGSLHISSLKEHTVVDMPFFTLPEKCTWAPASKNTLFCAIPESLPNGVILPDEWWQGMVSFNDGLWRINIVTGERQQLLPARQFDAVNLFLSTDESFLFFTNKKDGSLWSLHIKPEA